MNQLNFTFPGVGYPSLGSNYTPNMMVDERIARFLRNHPGSAPSIQTFIKEIKAFFDNKHVVEKSGTLAFNSEAGAFQVYLDDFASASNLTVTLVSCSDLTSGTNVGNIEQPEFQYNPVTGILTIVPASAAYAQYECYFVVTGDVMQNIELVYSFVYNTATA